MKVRPTAAQSSLILDRTRVMRTWGGRYAEDGVAGVGVNKASER
jgi:hypothetical protein